jgi:hypothetical protein
VGQIYGGHGPALVEVALVWIWQVGPHWALCRAWLRLSNIPILFQKQGCFDLEKYQINPPLPHKIPKLWILNDNFKRNNFPFGKELKFKMDVEIKIQETNQTSNLLEF